MLPDELRVAFSYKLIEWPRRVLSSRSIPIESKHRRKNKTVAVRKYSITPQHIISVPMAVINFPPFETECFHPPKAVCSIMNSLNGAYRVSECRSKCWRDGKFELAIFRRKVPFHSFVWQCLRRCC